MAYGYLILYKKIIIKKAILLFIHLLQILQGLEVNGMLGGQKEHFFLIWKLF